MFSIRMARRSTRANAGLPVLASLALLAVATACPADEVQPGAFTVSSSELSLSEALRPTVAFVQVGSAAEVTAATVGLGWNPGWSFLPQPWSVDLEASLSRWNSRGGYPSDSGTLTQLAFIPVFRWRADEGRSPWFWEGGVGVTVTSSVYRHESKRFSTTFNFGDHIGVGRSFGETRTHEVVLRFEHFSNAGIKHPNPGQNFVQLRYARRFD